MPIIFRPARANELQRAEELVVRSINDLTERHGFGPWLMKTLPQLASEMALHVLAYNLTRVMNIMGVQRFMAAMRA